LDEAAVQAKMAEVEEALHGVSSKLYEAAAAEMSEQDSDGEEEVVEADFEVVDSDEENE